MWLDGSSLKLAATLDRSGTMSVQAAHLPWLVLLWSASCCVVCVEAERLDSTSFRVREGLPRHGAVVCR
jgi:hypothetical protein